jgi:hypothetical protein
LAEIAAAKMMAGRRPTKKSGFAEQPGQRMMPGPWRSPAVEVIHPGRPATKKEPKAEVKSVPGQLEL